MGGAMVEIIAHRGARSIAPENSLAAARLAWETGAHRWETDVNLTQDRQLVLFHDLSLSRCTDAPARFGYPVSREHNEQGDPVDPGEQIDPGEQRKPEGLLPRKEERLINYTLAELSTLDLGSVFLSEDPFSTIAQGQIKSQDLSSFKGESIPTLEQGLILTRDLDFQINIELKDHGNEPEPFFIAGQTLEIVNRTGIPLEKVTISSFNHGWLNWVGQRAPEVEIQALVGRVDDLSLDFKDFSFATYNVNEKLITEAGIQELKGKGKKVNIFTVNDPQEFNRFINAGVDGIITDFPQRFAKKNRLIR